MNTTELARQLSEPFPSSDVEWRITKIHQRSGLAVPYITSRAIQNRLDNVVGPFCWRTRYIPWHQYVPKPSRSENPEQADRTPIPSQLCGLSIYDEDRQEWIEKIDGAENTDFESIKGGISDSFKRAAVLWGIGRYLYLFDAMWTAIDDRKRIANPAELTQYYTEKLQKLGLCTAQSSNGASGCYRVTGLTPTPVENYPNAAWIDLTTPDGRALKVFSFGTKPGLANGIQLQQASIVQRNSANGSYYELADYQAA